MFSLYNYIQTGTCVYIISATNVVWCVNVVTRCEIFVFDVFDKSTLIFIGVSDFLCTDMYVY